MSRNDGAMDSPSSSPDTMSRRPGRRRSLASPVGPPLLDAEDTPAVRRGGSSVPVLSLSKRPTLSWIIGGWVMDLSMYAPADAPPPVHMENRSHWPRAFLDYDDPSIMDDAVLARRGDAIVDLVRAECAARMLRLPDKSHQDDIVRKTFDGGRCLYVVHASMDIPSSFDDVVSILTHRSFFGHVFGHQLLAATELRRGTAAKAATPPSPSTTTTTLVQRLHLHVPRGYKRQQAMNVTFLDHVHDSSHAPPSAAATPTWTRVFKSIDRQLAPCSSSSTPPPSLATATSASSTRMTHVLGGLHVESLSASRCRLSFYGDSCVPSVLAVKMDGAHAFLDAFGQSVALVHRMLRRRRKSHRHHLHFLHPPMYPSSPASDDTEWDAADLLRQHNLRSSPPHARPPTTSAATTTDAIDTSRCRVCAVRFHYFRGVHNCATCLASFCAGCLRRHTLLCHTPSLSSPDSSPAPSPTHQLPTDLTSMLKPAYWKQCVAEPLRQSLSANHFSALLDEQEGRLLRRQYRAASFD
ncbi:hypothetical protein DYB28_014347 [Aphanomyces astaci]|uniref:Uncharacterized protein n=2 Tax=Aphanomyces astaci TaxID=112090 RepID=A0A397EIU0_APHAT|nr:hypothetical protein DYB36_010824 [Aphanomyces astaci]RHY43079.1 hypothetical protein DYB34_008021 [Aphanomyces astaci]RHY79848.1 hypothetical protein DYB30_010961 [Aphanomyces astaci]RLO08069.1 hypothetical protein DYB28_014347 [Aphanomyces astaci]